MPTLFSGRWRVSVTQGDAVPEQGFEIAGSDGVDGFYVPDPAAPFEIVVSGPEWSLDMRMMLPFENPEWVSFDPVRITRYRPPDGLTIRLSFDGDETLLLGPFELSQELLCVALDPELNPGFPVDPPDFTIPGG